MGLGTRNDPVVVHREPGAPLVSCGGSLEIVDLPYGQMEIPRRPRRPTANAAAAEAAGRPPYKQRNTVCDLSVW